MQCNIDSRGKIARLIGGLILLILAAILAILWAWPARSPLPWCISGILFIIGAFAVFEGRAGWCALRAMGFRTRL